MKKLSFLFALLCASVIGWAADPVVGSSTDNMAGQGSAFTNGYDYSFSTEGTSVTISFTEKENYTDLAAYLWNYTNGFAESGMAVSGHTASITLTNQTPGATIVFACKFAFAGGMSVTKQFQYTIPSGGGSTPEPASDEKFVAANATMGSWFAVPEWQTETNSTATYNDGVITVTIGNTKGAQWHAQVWLNLDFDYSTAKQYDFSIKFNSSEAVNYVSFKPNDKSGDNEMLYEDRSISLPEGEYTYTKTNVAGTANGSRKFLFDFGYASVGTTITISEISIIEHDAPATPEPAVTEPNTNPTAPTLTNPTYKTLYSNVVSMIDFAYWGDAVAYADFVVGENTMKKCTMGEWKYAGFVFANSVDASDMEYVHFDVWCAEAFDAHFYLKGGEAEKYVDMSYTPAGEWKSFAFPLSDFSTLGVDLTDLTVSKIADASKQVTFYFDNFYFYKEGEASIWDSEDWIGNATGNAGYTNKFKIHGHSCVNIQAPGFASAAGIYINDFAAPISYCSLGAGNYDVQGGGIILHADAFTAQVTEVAIIANHIQYIFHVYKEGATGTSNLIDAEPAQVYDVNFALEANGGYASATSGTAYLGSNGNNGDRWESVSSDPQIWTLDMCQRRIFNTVQIRWEGAYAKSFTIEVSNDGENWTVVKTVTDQELSGFPYEQNLEFAEQNARFVRFNGTARGTGYGYSFWEFRVLLPGVSTLTSIDLTAAGAIAEVGGAGIALTAQPKDQNGQNMAETVAYEITPAAAGHMDGNTYIPDQVGNASIRAYNGEVYSAAVTIAGYVGANLALNKEVEASGYNTDANLYPSFAVDNDEGSLWSARVGETGDERIYDAWIKVDLGDFYDINLIAIRWEGACSKHYNVEFSTNGIDDWRVAYAAGWNAVATHWEYLVGTGEDNTKVRYVRVFSTEAVSQYGIKIMDLKVFGVEWVNTGDTEAPVMTSASLVSKTWNSAVIEVAATDNVEVVRYHVVDATNNIDANYVAADGKITVTGLTAETAYNFTITAKDAANLESANSKAVAVTTDVHYIVPNVAAPTPTWPADQVKSLYSDTYAFAPASLNSYNEGWWNNPNMTEETVAENHYLHYDLYRNGMIGVQFADFSVALMEKIHIDIWASEAGSVRFRPITVGGPGDNLYKELVLEAEQWNSFDIDMTTDFPGHDWSKLYQYAIQGFEEGGMVGKHISVDNVYFYRTTAIVDEEAPTGLTANVTSTGLFSATISVQAADNMEALNYAVKNGDEVLANGAGVSNETVNITISGLNAGTHYELSVIASDEAGNETAPLAVNIDTRELPASAPAPELNGKKVIKVFSDAIEGDFNFGYGGWSETTAAQMVQLTGNDRAFHVSNFNYIGWHSFAAIDASEMAYLHVDIYSLGMTSMGITPISPGHELSTSQNLNANAWTSLDIPLSVYASANIDWSGIFQFKYDNPVGGNEALIDNVYFWAPAAKSNQERWATFASALNVTVPDDVTVYKAVYENNGSEEILTLTDAGKVIPAGTGVLMRTPAESTTYAFQLATAEEAAAATAKFEGNSLIGCTVLTDISTEAATYDIFCLRYSEAYAMSGFFLYSGQYIPAGKAYLKLSKASNQSGAPRRVRFVMEETDTATGMENAMDAVQAGKYLENGQLFIRRGDAVYTIQGARVK